MLQASFAMCTYNGEAFLQKQLESFTQQTVLPAELVVCDDCSTDATMEILERFALQAPFEVRIFRNEQNLGYVRNFEKAGRLCTRDVVFFSDQDDLWLPEKNEKTLRIFEAEESVGLVLLAASLIDAEDRPIPPSRRIRRKMEKNQQKEEIVNFEVQTLLHHWVASWQGCNMAYRNSLKEVIYPIHSELGHDQWILLLLGALSETRFLPAPTLLHRLHASNASRLSSAKKGLLERALYSLRRHQDPDRYRLKSELFMGLRQRIAENPEMLRHPELVPVFRRFEEHLAARAEALEFPERRWRLLRQEWKNGNYAFCSKGMKDLISDAVAFLPPQKTF